MQYSRRVLWLFILTTSLTLSSCFSYKDQILFQGLKDSSYSTLDSAADINIHSGDQLSIFVYASDQLSAQLFNAPMLGGSVNGVQALMQQGAQGGGYFGYLVDANGTIDFPKIGNIRVVGMTQRQLSDSLQLKLSSYLKSPVISVRLMNFRVTFINSDRGATTVIMNNNTNILQFLGMVGGIQWMDKRNNIRVIRQNTGVREVYTVNLTDASVFNSPVYYLQPNDIVYLEPNRRKFIETNVQLVNYFAQITSTLSILYLFINNFTK